MSELILYTETQRDELEQELAQVANKRELAERHNHGINVIAYWLVKENVCTIWVQDERTNSASEFVVPNDEVFSVVLPPVCKQKRRRFEVRAKE